MAVVLPTLVWKRSPNYSPRHGHAVTHLIWHATIGRYEGAIATLCDPDVGASAHLVLREDGEECTQLVRLADKAWHAYPYWNLRSVGIEHASLTRGFASHEQLERSARIFGWLCKQYAIPVRHGAERPSGLLRHRDLGVAGGGHTDGPSDHVWHDVFLPLVRAHVKRGGYKPVWAR